EVASVAFNAATASRFARQHRTNAHALDAGTLNFRCQILIDFLIGFDDDRAFNRIDNIFECRPADDAVTQALDFLAAFNNGLGGYALQRAAIRLADNYVLCDVYQTTGQITRIGGLQRRIRKAFARAVRGNEVLQYVQTFT